MTDDLDRRIAALDDTHALQMLAAATQRRGYQTDPFAWPHPNPPPTSPTPTQRHYRPPRTRQRSRPGPHRPHPPNPGSRRPRRRRPRPHHPNRHHPVRPRHPAVGALVLFAFHADIQLTHTPGHGWTFQFYTKPLDDTLVGKLLGQLIGVYLNPEPPADPTE